MEEHIEKKALEIYWFYKKVLEENPELPALLKQFKIDQEQYLDSMMVLRGTLSVEPAFDSDSSS